MYHSLVKVSFFRCFYKMQKYFGSFNCTVYTNLYRKSFKKNENFLRNFAQGPDNLRRVNFILSFQHCTHVDIPFIHNEKDA